MDLAQNCCLCAGIAHPAVSLLQSEHLSLLIWIREHLGKQVGTDERLPKQVCVPCTEQIHSWRRFRERCDKAYSMFIRWSENPLQCTIKNKNTSSSNNTTLMIPVHHGDHLQRTSSITNPGQSSLSLNNSCSSNPHQVTHEQVIAAASSNLTPPLSITPNNNTQAVHIDLVQGVPLLSVTPPSSISSNISTTNSYEQHIVQPIVNKTTFRQNVPAQNAPAQNASLNKPTTSRQRTPVKSNVNIKKVTSDVSNSPEVIIINDDLIPNIQNNSSEIIEIDIDSNNQNKLLPCGIDTRAMVDNWFKLKPNTVDIYDEKNMSNNNEQNNDVDLKYCTVKLEKIHKSIDKKLQNGGYVDSSIILRRKSIGRICKKYKGKSNKLKMINNEKQLLSKPTNETESENQQENLVECEPLPNVEMMSSEIVSEINPNNTNNTISEKNYVKEVHSNNITAKEELVESNVTEFYKDIKIEKTVLEEYYTKPSTSKDNCYPLISPVLQLNKKNQMNSISRENFLANYSDPYSYLLNTINLQQLNEIPNDIEETDLSDTTGNSLCF